MAEAAAGRHDIAKFCFNSLISKPAIFFPVEDFLLVHLNGKPAVDGAGSQRDAIQLLLKGGQELLGLCRPPATAMTFRAVLDGDGRFHHAKFKLFGRMRPGFRII